MVVGLFLEGSVTDRGKVGAGGNLVTLSDGNFVGLSEDGNFATFSEGNLLTLSDETFLRMGDKGFDLVVGTLSKDLSLLE